MKLSNAPMRLAVGAFVLHTGIEKFRGTPETAAAIHGTAVGAFPILSNIPAPRFLKALSLAEMALGTALLAPVVPPALAGAALIGFAGSLVTMYLRTPTLHRPNSIWPTPEGVGQSKDGWMLGVGLSLLSQGLGIDKFGKLLTGKIHDLDAHTLHVLAAI
jgi:hypothetical protein